MLPPPVRCLAARCLARWERFADLAPVDVVQLVAAVHAKPGRLARPLLRLGGRTLLHGDYWTPNLAPTDRGVVVIGWALATAGPPVVDFASFLVGCAGQVRASREEILDDLRGLWGTSTDQTALRLALAWVGAYPLMRLAPRLPACRRVVRYRHDDPPVGPPRNTTLFGRAHEGYPTPPASIGMTSRSGRPEVSLRDQGTRPSPLRRHRG